MGGRYVHTVELRGRDKTGAAFNSANRRVSKFRSRLSSIGRIGIGVALGQSLQQALHRISAATVETVDNLQAMENRLKLVVSEGQNIDVIKDSLIGIADSSYQSFSAIGKLYTRLGLARENITASNYEMERFTQLVAKATAISGATRQESAAGLQQLSQALQANRFQGDELRSVFENITAVARAIARGMDVNLGQLREMAKAGEVTAEFILRAILNQGEAIDEQFSKIKPTISQSAQLFENAFTRWLDAVDRSSGAFGVVSEAMKGSAEWLSEMASEMNTISREAKTFSAEINSIKSIQSDKESTLVDLLDLASVIGDLNNKLAHTTSWIFGLGDGFKFFSEQSGGTLLSGLLGENAIGAGAIHDIGAKIKEIEKIEESYWKKMEGLRNQTLSIRANKHLKSLKLINKDEDLEGWKKQTKYIADTLSEGQWWIQVTAEQYTKQLEVHLKKKEALIAKQKEYQALYKTGVQELRDIDAIGDTVVTGGGGGGDGDGGGSDGITEEEREKERRARKLEAQKEWNIRAEEEQERFTENMILRERLIEAQEVEHRAQKREEFLESEEYFEQSRNRTAEKFARQRLIISHNEYKQKQAFASNYALSMKGFYSALWNAALSFAGNNKKLQILAFAAEKGYMIGSAILSTHAAAAKVRAQWGSPIGDALAAKELAWGYANVGIMAATSLVQGAAKFGGGGGGGGGGGTGGSLEGGTSISDLQNNTDALNANAVGKQKVVIHLEGRTFGADEVETFLTELKTLTGDKFDLAVSKNYG